MREEVRSLINPWVVLVLTAEELEALYRLFFCCSQPRLKRRVGLKANRLLFIAGRLKRMLH